MNRIREERQRKKLTLKETVAELKKRGLISITSDTLSKYERGDREPKLATWQKLADFFGVSVTYLQGISKIKNASDLEKIADIIGKTKSPEIVKKQYEVIPQNEMVSSAYEATMKQFNEFYSAVFELNSILIACEDSDEDEYSKICSNIDDVGTLGDINYVTSELFKLGIKAQGNDKEAKKLYSFISELLYEYSGAFIEEDDE